MAALQPPKKAAPKPSVPSGVSQPPLPSRGLQAQAQSLKTSQAGGQAPGSGAAVVQVKPTICASASLDMDGIGFVSKPMNPAQQLSST